MSPQSPSILSQLPSEGALNQTKILKEKIHFLVWGNKRWGRNDEAREERDEQVWCMYICQLKLMPSNSVKTLISRTSSRLPNNFFPPALKDGIITALTDANYTNKNYNNIRWNTLESEEMTKVRTIARKYKSLDVIEFSTQTLALLRTKFSRLWFKSGL